MWPFERSHRGVSVRRRNLASMANIFQLAQVTLPALFWALVPLRVASLSGQNSKASWRSGGGVCPLTTEDMQQG